MKCLFANNTLMFFYTNIYNLIHGLKPKKISFFFLLFGSSHWSFHPAVSQISLHSESTCRGTSEKSSKCFSKPQLYFELMIFFLFPILIYFEESVNIFFIWYINIMTKYTIIKQQGKTQLIHTFSNNSFILWLIIRNFSLLTLFRTFI